MKREIKTFGIITPFIIVLLLFFSTCSPLYPINPWCDANCFFTVGKCIANGIVPYKDVFEQKGLLFYMLYTLGYWISNDSFIGIWIFECVSGAIYTFINYKTCEQISSSSRALPFAMLVSVMTYGVSFLSLGGSVEEFALPLLAYMLHIGTKALKSDDNFPTNLECFFAGVTGAIVLWSKFTLLIFYVAWYVPFIYFAVKNKTLPKLIKRTAMIVLGVITASVPVLIYCLATGSLTDMVRVYFMYNMTSYHGEIKAHMNVFTDVASLFC